jgi:hypothetical protein
LFDFCRDKDISGLLSGARLRLQEAAATKQELAALRDSSAQQQQAHNDLMDQHQQLQETALVLQAQLAASQAAAGVDSVLLKQLVPRLVLEAAAVLAARQAAEAACKSCTPQKMHRYVEQTINQLQGWELLSISTNWLQLS